MVSGLILGKWISVSCGTMVLYALREHMKNVEEERVVYESAKSLATLGKWIDTLGKWIEIGVSGF